MRIDREKTRTYLVRAGLALAAALVFLGPLPAGCHEQRRWSVMAAFAVLLGVIALVARGLDEKARPRADPVLILLGALAGVLLLQLVPLPAGLVGMISPTRAGLAREIAGATGEGPPAWLSLTTCLKCTRDRLLLLTAYVSVFYAASTLFTDGRRWKVIFGAAVAGAGVLALHGFTQVLEEWGTRLSSTFINPNRFAALMAMSGACAVGMFVAARRDRRGERFADEFRFPPGTIWLVAAVVVETALVLTLSRLGIASALVAGLLTIALFTRRRSVWAVLAGTLVVLAANAALAADPVLERYSVLFEGDLAGAGRPRCWRMALPVVRDFPVFGSGAGTFDHVFRLYQDPSLPGRWTFAHNDYLNLFTDTGLLGFALGAAAVALAMRRIVPLRYSHNPARRAVAIAGVLGLSAVAVHSVADFPLQEPAVGLLFFMLAGIAYGRAADTASTAKAPRAPRTTTANDGALGNGTELTFRRSLGKAVRRSWRPWRLGALAVKVVRRRWRSWRFAAYLAAALVLCAVTLPGLVRLRVSGRLKAEASGIPVGRDEEVERADLLRRVELLERAAVVDPWDATARYEAARTRVRLIAEGGYSGDPQSAIATAERELLEGRATSPLDPRPYYLGAVLAWRPDSPDSIDRADHMMLLALRTAPAWHDVSYQVGSHFLKRWRHASRGKATFGLFRWQETLREPDELFRRAARALTFAARSPRASAAAVALVLDHGLSSREIDAALSPDAETELALARGLARRDDHAGARPRYERALSSGELPGPLHRVHVSYARSLLKTGERDAALKGFDAALRDSPPEELGATIRALASFRLAKADAGPLADYWAAVRGRMPDEPAVLMALARAQLAAGRDEAGFAHLLEYAEQTRDAGAFAELARFALGGGELKLAATLASEAARLDPERVSHHVMLAAVLTRLGRRDAAAASFAKVLLLEPRNLAAARTLAGIELEAGRYRRAITVWERFIAAGGAPAPAHEALADIYLTLLDRDRAAEELVKALDAKPAGRRAGALSPRDDERLRRKLEGIRRTRPGG